MPSIVTPITITIITYTKPEPIETKLLLTCYHDRVLLFE